MYRSRWGTVSAVLAENGRVQELAVTVGGAPARAMNYISITGAVAPGVRVLLNTTAVELDLGSGGWHFVMAVEGREERLPAPPGHLMKLRYTPWQFPVTTIEERLAAETDGLDRGLAGMPVVACELHSQLAPAALAVQGAGGGRVRLAYVMTDGGALPLAFSRSVAALKEAGLVDVTITAGHAFGGDHEAVTVHGALAGAQKLCGAEVAIVAMGPGIAGTGTSPGFSGVEQSWILDAAAAMGGRPVAAARMSFADPRRRHRGLSHHTLTNLGRLVRSRVTLAIPGLPPEQAAAVNEQIAGDIAARHEIRQVAAELLAPLLEASPVPLETMGRGFAADPAFFLAAAAAGWTAGEMACR